MFDFDTCPRCNESLPYDQIDLQDMINEQQKNQYYFAADIDEWYCPHCSYNFAYVYDCTTTMWFDLDSVDLSPVKLDIDDSLILDYYVCCGTFADPCNCEKPVALYDLEFELSQLGIYAEDFYAINFDRIGLDCTSCLRLGSDHCPIYMKELHKYVTGEKRSENLITPCQDYAYKSVNEDKYHYGALTPSTIRVQFPQTLQKDLSHARP